MYGGASSDYSHTLIIGDDECFRKAITAVTRGVSIGIVISQTTWNPSFGVSFWVTLLEFAPGTTFLGYAFS